MYISIRYFALQERHFRRRSDRKLFDGIYWATILGLDRTYWNCKTIRTETFWQYWAGTGPTEIYYLILTMSVWHKYLNTYLLLKLLIYIKFHRKHAKKTVYIYLTPVPGPDVSIQAVPVSKTCFKTLCKMIQLY